MSLILSRNRGGAVTIAPPAGNRRSVQPIRSVIRVVQAPSNNGAQVSSPRQRRRRVRPRGRMAVSVPATSGQARINVQPRFSGSNGRMTVAHSEVLEEVFGSTGFSGVRYAVTPIALPYLKGVAQNFSRYRWLSCRVSFITSSPTSQSGTVGMGATYDGLDLLPNTMSELGSLAHNSIGPVWGPPGTRANTLVFDSSRWSKAWYPYYDGNVSLEDIVSYIPAFLILGKQTQAGSGHEADAGHPGVQGEVCHTFGQGLL
jgi:hypothetical protein